MLAFERLIHISGVGADPVSDSPYVRARGIGEDLVKGAFEGVTMLAFKISRPERLSGPAAASLKGASAVQCT